jgi:hypothetical protein
LIFHFPILTYAAVIIGGFYDTMPLVGFFGQHVVRKLKWQVSGVGCQGKKMLDAETRHQTLETFINYQRAYCPAGATFSQRSLGKSLEPTSKIRQSCC